MVITTLMKPQFSLFCYICLYTVISLLLQIWEQTYLTQFFKRETGIKESYKSWLWFKETSDCTGYYQNSGSNSDKWMCSVHSFMLTEVQLNKLVQPSEKLTSWNANNF